MGNAQGSTSNPNPPTPLIDRAVIEKSVKSLLTVADKVIGRHIYQASFQAAKGRDGADVFAKAMLAKCEITEEELKLISELSAVVCEKHQLIGQYAPEIFLALAIGGYVSRPFFAIQQLRDLQKQWLAQSRAQEQKDRDNRNVGDG
jgi:hypothetical protein